MTQFLWYDGCDVCAHQGTVTSPHICDSAPDHLKENPVAKSVPSNWFLPWPLAVPTVGV